MIILLSVSDESVKILIAATRGGAEVMRQSNDLGHMQAGMRADLLVLDANPLADIRNIRRLVMLMKGDQVLRCNQCIMGSSCAVRT